MKLRSVTISIIMFMFIGGASIFASTGYHNEPIYNDLSDFLQNKEPNSQIIDLNRLKEAPKIDQYLKGEVEALIVSMQGQALTDKQVKALAESNAKFAKASDENLKWNGMVGGLAMAAGFLALNAALASKNESMIAGIWGWIKNIKMPKKNTRN